MMTPYWTNDSCNPFDVRAQDCLMGTYVRYAVNVSSVEHIQATIAFAQRYNIRFVIRNTGHDFMGKSTGYGSLAIWTHYLTGMSIIENYKSPAYTGPAVKALAGTQVGELYNFTSSKGYVAIGGECPTVGWAGGYTSGGGHSALSSWKGLAADQVLEMEVILANGTFTTVSATKNSDLLWALSGGGPGNYAIVWSLTARIYPDIPVTAAEIIAPQGSVSDSDFWSFIDFYHTKVAGYTSSGAYAYAFYQTGYFQLLPFFAPESSADEVNAAIAPLLQKLAELGFQYTTRTVEYDNFKDAFFGEFAPINTGLFSFGGRLIPSSLLTSNPTGFSRALRQIAQGGAAIIEAGMAPSLNVAANVTDNSVLPAWRDSVMYLIPAAPWNQTGGSAAMATNLKYKDTITNVWDPALKALTPGGGSYMSEADGNDPDWAKDWFGSNYGKLLKVKEKYDCSFFFYGDKMVGSDYWTIAANGRMCKNPDFQD
jgi:hypothetical protein